MKMRKVQSGGMNPTKLRNWFHIKGQCLFLIEYKYNVRIAFILFNVH